MIYWPTLTSALNVVYACRIAPSTIKPQNENESPRGRIALIQAWAGRHLEASKKLVDHIDNCLLCRSCEQVCPAEVTYGKLINDFREQIKRRS